MRIDVVTLFPEWVAQLEDFGVVGRGLRESRLELACWNPREDADNASGRVDDRPYGGGPGMVMQAPPLEATLDRVRMARADSAPVIMPSPQGERFDQRWAERLADGPGFVLVCGRYEGIDQRFVDAHVDVELSMGDVVLSGGELPAMMIIDAVARLLSGVLGDSRSAQQDSFTDGLLDHPHYTRPPSLAGAAVPDVLLSGDHARIERWREKQALGVTWQRRPDLLDRLTLSAHQQALLDEYIADLAADKGSKTPPSA
ncbi:tRNA (guanine-N(1)-)-methyltransferase [Salinisphaera dokdonensis CL-ES53]|uniref:tRNA (guanine-N(1)-)-methyltransferase n=1 Tax=Salinisphaera dokdonensis CL-ES53 TaxID=1304272 RepID=A0ABV2AW76_9GAMM